MKKVMCGVLMLGWIPTLAVVAGARWTEALFAQGRDTTQGHADLHGT